MTKLSKKVMSLVVASSVAITSIFAGDMLGSNSAKAADTDKLTKKITFHFKNDTGKDAEYVKLTTEQEDAKTTDDSSIYNLNVENKSKRWYSTTREVTSGEKIRFKTKISSSEKYYYPKKPSETTYDYITCEFDETTTDLYYVGNSSQKFASNPEKTYLSDFKNATATPTATATIKPTTSAGTTSAPSTNYEAGKVLIRYTASTSSDWKNKYVYVHYTTDSAADNTSTWHYQLLEKINNTWYYTLNLGSADQATLQFCCSSSSTNYKENRVFERKNSTDTEALRYVVKAGTVDINGSNHTMKQTNASSYVYSVTPSPTPSATPYIVPTAKILATVAPIQNMPYVDSDMGSNATFADGSYDDSLTMILTLKNGATRATYTVDDGPVCEITKANNPVSVKIGQGKIVGEPIVMNITTTDGTKTSTQTFTYTKVANYSTTNMQRTPKFTATAAPTVAPTGTYTIEFKKPASWTLNSNQKIYLYSYCDDATTTTEPTKPNGEWPGTIMTSADGTWYTGVIKNANVNTRYIISNCSVNGTTKEVTTIAQFPEYVGENVKTGFLVRDGLKVIDGLQQTVGTTPEANALIAYFGSTVSTPQKVGTGLTLRTVVQNAVGNVTYSYYVSGTGTINVTPNGTAILDTALVSKYPDGKIPVTATVSDDKYTITMTKYFAVSKELNTIVPIPTPVATSSATPTVKPTTTPTLATTTPSVTTAPTATPVIMPTIDPNPAVNPTLTVDGTISFSSATQSVGKAVNINVALTNQKANATYSFTYFVDDEPIASTTTATTAKWVADEVGQHIVKVIVLENGVSVATLQKSYKVTSSTVKFTSVKTNKKSGVKANTSIKITAKAKSSVGSVKYRFEIKKGSSTTVLKNYSSKSSVVWKPKKKGTYKIVVYAKNKYKKVVKKTITFKVK